MPSSTMCNLKFNATATSERQKKLPPVITNFLEAIGKLPQVDTVKNENGAPVNSQSKTENVADTIDDPRRSTLAKGKHQRYRALMATKHQWNPAQRNECRKLSRVVQEEQQSYHAAVLEFWEKNKDRILVGFSGASRLLTGARFAEAAVKAIMEPSWLDEFQNKTYGKCIQVISLELSKRASKGNRFPVEEIETELANSDSYQETATVALLQCGSTVPLSQDISSRLLLKDDETALQLAKLHKVDVVASLESLEKILNLEKDSWLLPVSFRSGIAIIDFPAPQSFSCPRDCLTEGLAKGLMVDQAQRESPNTTMKELNIKYRYVILYIPQIQSMGESARRLKSTKTKLLVRVPKQSTRTHAHIEYFPERGEEIPSSHERAVWILDSFLFPRSVVARIDPSSCKILKWEDTSLAHALAATDHSAPFLSQISDPTDHWDCLAQLLQAIPTIGREGSFLLCAPGRDLKSPPRSVSVHMAVQQEDAMIDMKQELKHAGEVKLGSEAIFRSVGYWKWCDERIPYTFPLANVENP